MSDIRPLGETSYPCLAIARKYGLSYWTVLCYVDWKLGYCHARETEAVSLIIEHFRDRPSGREFRDDVKRFVLRDS
jgi:hypothetical protein